MDMVRFWAKGGRTILAVVVGFDLLGIVVVVVIVVFVN
jgi:hypothetical protein